MRAYSHDFRTHLLRAIDQGRPKPEAARVFGVSTRTIERYQQRRRATGAVQPRPSPGRQRLITPEQSAALWFQLERMPTATLAEHCLHWAAEQGVVVSTATMSRQIHRLGWTKMNAGGRQRRCGRTGRLMGARRPTELDPVGRHR